MISFISKLNNNFGKKWIFFQHEYAFLNYGEFFLTYTDYERNLMRSKTSHITFLFVSNFFHFQSKVMKIQTFYNQNVLSISFRFWVHGIQIQSQTDKEIHNWKLLLLQVSDILAQINNSLLCSLCFNQVLSDLWGRNHMAPGEGLSRCLREFPRGSGVLDDHKRFYMKIV